ncbi:cupredoxin domain-containing protein [Chloroflexota bacterium]
MKKKMLSLIILGLALILTVALAVSCQSQSQAPAPVPPTGGNTPLAPTTGEPESATPLQIEVIIQGSTFIPDTQNIPAGALVLWYNDDSVDHTVTARDNSFDSGRISPNETFEYTFEHPGEVEYYCKIHPSMVGKITIE